jgi:hypothetical protein
MGSAALDRIMCEINGHPKEKIGFDKKDFDAVIGDERDDLIELFVNKISNGSKCSEQLEWLLGERYVSVLKARLASLPPKAHGRVFLPYFIYLTTHERDFALQMMPAIVEADPTWEPRENAIGGYLRKIIGDEPIFLDFCRYVVLNVPEEPMKHLALLWLAYQKRLIAELSLPKDLEDCVRILAQSNGTDRAARSVVDRIHADTGTFSM